MEKEPTTSTDTQSGETLSYEADPSLSGHRGAGETEDLTCDSPKRKPEKTRWDREKPKLSGQAAANKHLEQMLSDSLQGGAGKGLTIPTKIGVLSKRETKLSGSQRWGRSRMDLV